MEYDLREGWKKKHNGVLLSGRNKIYEVGEDRPSQLRQYDGAVLRRHQRLNRFDQRQQELAKVETKISKM